MAKRRYEQMYTNVACSGDRQLAQTQRRRKPRGKARQKRREGSCSLTLPVKHMERKVRAFDCCLLQELASFRCLRSLDWEVMKTLQTRHGQENLRRMAWVTMVKRLRCRSFAVEGKVISSGSTKTQLTYCLGRRWMRSDM